MAPATWSCHGKHWAEWLGFVPAGADLDSSTCFQATISFLAALRSSGVSVSLARKKLGGVAFMLKLLRKEDVTKAFLVRLLLKGWSKSGARADTRRPVSFLLLQRLFDALVTVCADPYEVLLFRCSFALAFFGALRVSEFTAPNARSVAPLAFADIVLFSDSVRLRISRSKTDQYGRGTWLSISSIQHDCCPVRLLRSFVAVRPHSDSFLSHRDGSPVTRYQFGAVFKKCLLAVGLPPSDFGTHSFRIGAATVADASGLPDDVVKRLGRWKSDCFRRYIRPNLLTF